MVYGFVGTQMTWRLSPFVGKPDDPFYWVRPSRDNFYVDVVKAIQGALDLPASDMGWLMPLVFGGLCFIGLGVVFFTGGIMIGSAAKKSAPKVDVPQASS